MLGRSSMVEQVIHRPWEDERYARISSATVDDGSVVVSFANGDVVRLDLEHAFPDAGNVDWDQLHVEPFELALPSESGDQLEVSWLRLRTISDPEFASHLALEA